MQIQVDKVDFVPVNSLVPHPKNMNKHPEDQIERLCRLIEYQGFRNPLVVQLGTNLIVAGHGRLEAAKKLGYEKVPVTYQKFDDEAQLYAYMTSDNAIASWAELDLSQINVDIQDLGPELDVDMLAIKHFTVEPMDSLVDTVNASDESAEWAQMEDDFEAGDDYIKLIVHFKTELEREVYCKENYIEPKTKMKTGWIAYK